MNHARASEVVTVYRAYAMTALGAWRGIRLGFAQVGRVHPSIVCGEMVLSARFQLPRAHIGGCRALTAVPGSMVGMRLAYELDLDVLIRGVLGKIGLVSVSTFSHRAHERRPSHSS